MSIESDLVAPDPLLESDLIEVVNKHIRASDGQGQALRPEVACEVLAIMATDVLKAMEWHPGNIRAANRCLRMAIVHLRGG